MDHASFQKYEHMSREEILADFFARDQSHLWPVRGRFHVTRAAIKIVAGMEKANGTMDGVEYAATLDRVIGFLVNRLCS